MADDSKKSDSSSKDSAKPTPLERYLAKARAAEAATPASSAKGEAKSERRQGWAKTDAPRPAPSSPAEDARALEAGVPVYAPQPKPERASVVVDRVADRGPSRKTTAAWQPAPFWSRMAAYIVDLIVLSVITSSVKFALQTSLFFVPAALFSHASAAISVLVIFFYYGWFYAEKGASPGKLLLQLRVEETGTGRRLGYWRSFFRETVGKFISGLLLGLGFLLAALRADHRALHDLIFDTRVTINSV